MSEKVFSKTSMSITAIIAIAIWSLLAWDYYHGGVPSHHLLHREDLPAISNWWGGILLPLLTWFLLYRIQQRLTRENVERSNVSRLPASVFYGFTAALFFGILLSVLFSFGYSDIMGYLLGGILLLALFFPIYRAECLLGFVIGMTFTFGGVLPTAFGSILVLVCAALYLYLRPGILYIVSRSSNKHKADK